MFKFIVTAVVSNICWILLTSLSGYMQALPRFDFKSYQNIKSNSKRSFFRKL